MSMPDLGAALHFASLDYFCTFGELQAAIGPITFSVPDPVRFRFTFDTGRTQNSDGTVTVTWDYSLYNKGATETALALRLDQICTPIAALLGLTLAQVQAAVTVKRVWTVTPNIQGAPASSGGTVLTSFMPYPTVIAASDQSAAADGGESVH